jgi:hypothetical protein
VILILYAILSTAMFYLGSRALITEGVWRYYPPRLARFMDCAACTGFWWGMIWHVVIGCPFELDITPIPPEPVAGPLVAGLCMLVLTPIVAALMQVALERLGTVVDDSDA